MDTDRFIKEVMVRPVIWNTKHPHHKFKLVVTRTWGEIWERFPDFETHPQGLQLLRDLDTFIRAEISETRKQKVADLRKKWKNLKDAYRKELKKVSKLQQCDENNDGLVPLSNWVHFAALDFLRGEGVSFPEEVEEEDKGAHHSAVLEDSSSDNETKNTETRLSPSASPLRTGTASSHHQTAKKRQKSKLRQEMQAEHLEIERKRLKLLETEVNRQNSEEKSDNYHFLMSLLPEMAKLSPMQKMRLRNKINQALMDEMTVAMYGDPLLNNGTADSQVDCTFLGVTNEQGCTIVKRSPSMSE